MLALFAAACGPAVTNNSLSEKPEYSFGREMRYLDSANPSLSWPVPPTAAARRPKFVIVRIGRVTNPARVPLEFAVSFRSSGERTVELGSFSLYPANNPGRFIVATQAKIAPNGEIVVTLRDSTIKGMESVQVGVAELALGDQ